MNDLIRQIERDPGFANSVDAIQQPRTGYALRHFVVGQHDTPGQQWAQCVLEMQNKLTALATARIDREIAELQIARLEKRGTPVALLKAKKKRIELQQLEWAELGAVRELSDLYAIYKSFGRTWTRDDLEQEQEEYWRRRLARQAALDVNATGRIGVGNQDALRMAGLAAPGQPDYIRQVEQRFLAEGKMRILVTVPTLIPREQIEREGLRCLDGWSLPGTFEHKLYVVTGRPVADAYTDAALTAMRDGADFLLTVEDDHVIPPGTFERIWGVYQQHGPRAIVGAWYPQKREPRAGAPIVLRGRHDGMPNGGGHAGSDHVQHGHGQAVPPLSCAGSVRPAGCVEAAQALRPMEMQLPLREYLEDDGETHEVFAVPMGFTLIPVSIFRELPQPWFATTGALTQDAFFSQLAREAGYRLLVDTGARIKHVCRETGRVYE